MVSGRSTRVLARGWEAVGTRLRRSASVRQNTPPARCPPLLFVLGSQRSGTNALRRSLSLDRDVRGFNEKKSDHLYDRWRLRPEPEIRIFLQREPGIVLLKPIQSVIERPVGEFLDEFSDYDLRAAWIYRDPVAVFYSRMMRWSYRRDVDQFVREWNRVNRSALEALDSWGDRMVVVRYEDLVADRGVFDKLCLALRVTGEYVFRPDESKAYAELAEGDIDRIQLGTGDTLEALEAARRFVAEARPAEASRPDVTPLPRLVFVLGSQRSGTNALRRSLSLDPNVRGFNEKQSDRLHDDWKLRPEPEIRDFLIRQRGTVLLKPIVSVIERPLGDFLRDFSEYDVRVVWIYRDPVAVYHSRAKHWSYRSDVGEFLDEWNRVNRSALEALDTWRRRMVVVRYDDLVADRRVFRKVSRALRVDGEYLFRAEESKAYQELSEDVVAKIQEGTRQTLSALDAARTFKSDAEPVASESRDRARTRRSPPTPREFLLALPHPPRRSRSSLRTSPRAGLTVRAPGNLHLPRVLQRSGLAGFERAAIACYLAVLQTLESGTVFDVGANIGVYSLLAAALTEWRVVGFEPTPELADTLEGIVRDNGLECTVERLALGDSNGTARLYLSDRADVSNSLARGFRPSSESIDVAVETLDSYSGRTGVRPDLMKVDTESTEPAVLSGAAEILNDRRPWILCEVLSGRTGRELTKILGGRDYACYRIGADVPLPRSDEIAGSPDPDARNWLFAPVVPSEPFWRSMGGWQKALARCTPR